MYKIVYLSFLMILTNIASAIRPDSVYYVNPNHFGLVYKEINFLTSDSILLKGWFIPSQQKVDLDSSMMPAFYKNPIQNNYKNEFEPKPTIILCDGDGGNMSYTIWMANAFLVTGYNIFMFDWRGFGQSQKWEIDQRKLIIPEFLLDYDAAINSLDTIPEVDTSKICLYGYSTGFYLSFAAAILNNKVKCLAGRALITNLSDLKNSLASVKDTSNILIPNDYPNELMPIECASKLKVPILMIVGEKDQRTPVWMSKMVYEKINSPKELKIIEGKDHCTIEAVLIDTIFQEIGIFYHKYLDN